MQAAATALEFVKLKNSDQKKKPPTESMMAMVLTSLSLSLSLRICAPRARVDFNCLFLLFLCCSVLRAWARALAPGPSSSRTCAERRKKTLILRTFQPTIMFSYLPVLRNRCRWIPTYLPTYLLALLSNSGRFHWLSKKRDLRNQKEKGSSFCPFSFLFFQLCHYCWQMGSVSSAG